MRKRCCNCFMEYEDAGNMCPHCGYVSGENGKEIYYLKPGTVLKNPYGKEYIIGEAIGAGGFGIIYIAWQKELDRKVAIKEYFPTKMVTRGAGEERVAVFSNKKEAEYRKGLFNFLQEATIMGMCAGCDNVCDSYDKFEANGTAYMVMEYLNGKTLKKYIEERKGKPLEEAEIISYIIQVLNGLDQIHKRGVLHLDVAPDNIFVMHDGRIKIMDFGAGKSPKVLKSEDEIVVKPGFAPPEQYRANAKLGPEADIYAVGADLYWLLTGQVPIESTDRVAEDIMEEPSKLAIVSPLLNNVVTRAMAVKTELRYRNCKEFIEALHKEEERSLEEEIERRKRNRKIFLASVSLVLAVVIMAAGYFGVFRNKIWDDTITVWVSARDYENESEKMRYMDISEQFKTVYPDIDVEIVVKSADTIEQEFLEANDEERPDLIEVSGRLPEINEEFENLSAVVERNEELMLTAINAQNFEKTIPTGFYVGVIYAQNGKAGDLWADVADVESFLKNKTGYFNGDSSQYYRIQNEAAGQYQLIEDEEKSMYVGEKFAVYKRSSNKKKAAIAFLEYILTDAAQDILHVQYKSGYMPVTNGAWQEYINVYDEFSYLENSINQYMITEDN